MVYDIQPGPGGSIPVGFTIWNNKLYFIADSVNSYILTGQLWKYDELSPPQHVPTGNIAPSGFNEPERMMDVFQNKLYFRGGPPSAPAELCVFDSINPPSLVSDIFPGSTPSDPQAITATPTKLYFNACPDYNTSSELFSFRGSGPLMLHDVWPGKYAAIPPPQYVLFNGRCYFNGHDGIHGNELMSVDTATDSPSIVADICPGNFQSHSNPLAIHVYGNKLYFFAQDNQNTTNELYSYSGPGTLTKLTNLSALGIYYAVNQWCKAWAIFKNELYFTTLRSPSDTMSSLMKYNYASGTVSTVTQLYHDRNIPNMGNRMDMIAYDTCLYFNGVLDTMKGNEIYKYDGKAFKLVADIRKGKGSSYAFNFTIYNNHLYFVADDSLHGRELWRLTSVKDTVTPTITPVINSIKDLSLYPNPTANNCNLSFVLKNDETLGISLFALDGLVKYQTIEKFTAGKHEVAFTMGLLPKGEYFYCIRNIQGAVLTSGKVLKQ
jgi:ELWxxDGT repeat protein